MNNKKLSLLPILLCAVTTLSVLLTELGHDHLEHNDCEVCVCLNHLTDQISNDSLTLTEFLNPFFIHSFYIAPKVLDTGKKQAIIRGPPSKLS